MTTTEPQSLPMCEDCQDEDHWNCDGLTWDEDRDDWRRCECPHVDHDAPGMEWE